MKKLLILNFSFFIFHSAFASAFAACGCGVAPERENDFWWENDKFGMRAYGPGEFHKWSGLDIFNKMRGAASVGDLLRKRLGPVGNWHTTVTHGLLDNYTVGAGRGCGATASGRRILTGRRARFSSTRPRRSSSSSFIRPSPRWGR